MTRDVPELDSALAPLARRGAPAGFASRLTDRYRQGMAARRRRAALLVSAGSLLLLAALVAAGAIASHLTAIPLREWLGAFAAGTVHAVVIGAHAAGHVLTSFATAAMILVTAATATAACCVVLAALMRDQSFGSRVQ